MRIYCNVLVVLFLLQGVMCVKGPVTSEGEYSLVPEYATPVTSSDIDACFSDSGDVTIIEFYSDKCPVCTSLIWVIDSLYITLGDSAFVGVNNTNTDTLWKRYSVNTVPTYVLYKSGEEITRISFTKNEPKVYDTLALLIRQIIAGTLVPDTADTSAPIDTIPDNYLTLDEATFDSTVLRKGTTAMVFFIYAGGAPCIFMDSVVRYIAPRFKNRAVIAKVLAWNQTVIYDRYDIHYVPQFLFFKDSILQEDAWRDGIVEGDTLIDILERLLSGTNVSFNSTFISDTISVEDRIEMVDFIYPNDRICVSIMNMVNGYRIGSETLFDVVTGRITTCCNSRRVEITKPFTKQYSSGILQQIGITNGERKPNEG